MENLTINQDLLIELLKLGMEYTKPNQPPIESYHSLSSYMSQGVKVNGGFIQSLAILLKSKNEDFNIDLFRDKIFNGSSAYEDKMKETLLSILAQHNH